MAILNAGDKAPDFTLDTLDGKVTLSEMLKENSAGVIVYFYPKASTPGCTKEACDFRDSLASLQAAGYGIIGISPDKLPAIQKFVDKQSLNFPLAADPEHKVLEAYGAWGEKKNYGRIYEGVIRSTIVVGADGKVKLAQYNVRATGHVARLRKDLGLD